MAFNLRFSRAVAAALKKARPVVALESSVVAQGLPFPHNLEAARACEEAVIQQGAVPAMVAVVDGEICVGLSDEAIERLASGAEPLSKIGSRDLAAAIAGGLSGGTTVSATCEVASAAGIRVFATGGIGGIHRGVAEHLDISQDLWALSRFPVAVVCAGAKTVLDLPKTLEALEALAVPVFGLGTRDFPGFYTRTTGLALEHDVEDAAQAAHRMRIRFDQLNQGGMIFAVPPPVETALDPVEVEMHLSQAMIKASQVGIRGKAVTPFLLSELVQRTAGRSLRANLALLAENARFAAQVAVAYAARQTGSSRKARTKVPKRKER